MAWSASRRAFLIPKEPGEQDIAADRSESLELLEEIVDELSMELSGWVSLERWQLWLVKDLGQAETLALLDRAAADDYEAIAELRARGNVPENANAVFAAAGVVGVDCLVVAAHAVLACASLAPQDYDPAIS